MSGAGIGVFVAMQKALDEETRFVGEWVSDGIRKALVGEGLSHIVDGALTDFCAYRSSSWVWGTE